MGRYELVASRQAYLLLLLDIGRYGDEREYFCQYDDFA